MLTAEHWYLIIHVVVFAVTFADILTMPKMIFGFYGGWLDRLEQTKYGWMAYPLGYCAKCTAGQIAMWVFVVRALLGWESLSLAPWRFIVFCCAAVLLAEIASGLLKRLQRG